jgi:serine/threonine protein kinase
VLYEMATGAMPFRGESSGVIFHAILERDPVPAVRLNPDLPPRLEDIVNKALEKDRNLRYQGAGEMRADLQRLKRDTESGNAPDLYRVRIADKGLEQVASLRGVCLSPTYGGLLNGLTPDDSPLILRDAGSQEIYALDLELP